MLRGSLCWRGTRFVVAILALAILGVGGAATAEATPAPDRIDAALDQLRQGSNSLRRSPGTPPYRPCGMSDERKHIGIYDVQGGRRACMVCGNREYGFEHIKGRHMNDWSNKALITGTWPSGAFVQPAVAPWRSTRPMDLVGADIKWRPRAKRSISAINSMPSSDRSWTDHALVPRSRRPTPGCRRHHRRDQAPANAESSPETPKGDRGCKRAVAGACPGGDRHRTVRGSGGDGGVAAEPSSAHQGLARPADVGNSGLS